jgi:hypothetical protein
LRGKIRKQKVLTKGNNGLQRMTKLEASFTQLINQAASGDLKALDLLAKMMISFPETVKPRDVEDKVSSAAVLERCSFLICGFSRPHLAHYPRSLVLCGGWHTVKATTFMKDDEPAAWSVFLVHARNLP